MNYLIIFFISVEKFDFWFLIPYKRLDGIDLELIENRLGSIISDINKQRFSIKNQINTDTLIKEMENEFVPINISDNPNFDIKTFDDLTPCYSTDGSGSENNENTNSNSFTILS